MRMRGRDDKASAKEIKGGEKKREYMKDKQNPLPIPAKSTPTRTKPPSPTRPENISRTRARCETTALSSPPLSFSNANPACRHADLHSPECAYIRIMILINSTPTRGAKSRFSWRSMMERKALPFTRCCFKRRGCGCENACVPDANAKAASGR